MAILYAHVRLEYLCLFLSSNYNMKIKKPNSCKFIV